MTHDELQGILLKYAFRGLLSFLEVELSLTPPGPGVPHPMIVLSVSYPDRDTGEKTHSDGNVYVDYWWKESQIRARIEEWLMEVWVHEFHEGLVYAENRVTDMHSFLIDGLPQSSPSESGDGE